MVTKTIKPVQRFKYCDLKWFELLALSGTAVTLLQFNTAKCAEASVVCFNFFLLGYMSQSE
jgi:hypothetical protein